MPLTSIPSSALGAGQRRLKALPQLPLRLHHPVEERFTCASCGLLLIEASPAVPARPLAFAAVRCECGHHSLFPGDSRGERGVA